MTPDPDHTRAVPPALALESVSDPDRTRQRAKSDTVGESSAPDPTTRPDDSTRPRWTGPTADTTPPSGFVLDRELGAGGMGVVYLARQVGLNRPVALKLVKDARVDGKALIRFLAEAEAVAAIKHPNVVEVYQYGEHDGKPYMALEYCPGGDLTSLVQRDPLAVSREAKTSAPKDGAWYRTVAELMAKVADGVNAAHALGIVHRDLKPHNVFLTADGTPKVADFGLAKRGVGSDLTNTQAVMGTPAYMAPEQAGGGTKFVGPEADVWALGVMLYELCSGERPIDTRVPMMDAIARVAKGEVLQLRAAAPAVPADLALIAHKCLSLDPRDRYPTAGGLATDLRNWLDGKPISARPVGVIEQAVKWAKRNKRLAVMGLAVLLTMAVATAISFGFGLEANTQRKKADDKAGELITALGEKTTAEADAKQKAGDLKIALDLKTTAEADAKRKAGDLAVQLTEMRRVLDLTRLREVEGDINQNAMLSAREKLAEIAPENRCIVWGLLRQRVEESDLTLWGHTARVISAAFSPDGRRIVTGSWDKTARVWDATTGVTLFELKGHSGEVRSVAFSGDGRRIATGANNDKTVRVWDATTGRSLLELNGAGFGAHWLTFSPDGQRLATGGVLDNIVRVWDVATGERRLELKGHTGPVWRVAFSPDGGRLASTSRDKTARVWDAVTGDLLHVLTGHTSEVFAVAFSPDGRRIATGSVDKSTRVWDATTGQTVKEIKAADSVGHWLAFSPDGRKIFTWSNVGNLIARVWDVNTGQHLGAVVGGDHPTPLALSPDGTRLVTNSGDTTRSMGPMARVWDATTSDRNALELKGHAGFIPNIAFSRDGGRLVTASLDKTARVWDTAIGKTLFELKGHSGEVFAVAFSSDGRRIATGSVDKTARVWDATTGQLRHELTRHADEVTGVAFSSDGRRIATASRDKTVRVWDAATGEALLEIKCDEGMGGALSVAFSPDGTRLATAHPNTTARTWDATTGRKLVEFRGENGPMSCVAFSPDGSRLVAANDTTARVWDAATGETRLDLKGHTGIVTGVAFSPDGRRIATSTLVGGARMWDAATGQSLLELKEHSGGTSCVAFSPDGRRIAVGSNNTARVWEAATGRHLFELKGHGGGVSCAATSPDGQRIVSGSGDTALVWDVATRSSVFELKGHTDGVSAVAVSRDGSRIVTGSRDKTARVWDAATGRSLHELKGHTNDILSVGFSPNGRWVVTGSLDKTARVWDAATGQSLHELKVQGGGVYAAAFSLDGRRVVTGSSGDTTRVWDVTSGKHLPLEPVPDTVRIPNVLPDGRFVVPYAVRVAIIDPAIDELELNRRLRVARPDPQRHAKLAAQYQADPFASAVQKSLEQKARGQLAVEAGDFQQAFGHFLAAELIRPKPISPELPKK